MAEQVTTLGPIEVVKSDLITQADVAFAARHSYLNPPESIKIPGWSKFNETVGGFRMGEFSLLCGATGSGKTQFLCNVSHRFLNAGIKHYVASIETGNEDWFHRIMSIDLGDDVNSGRVSREKFDANWEKQKHVYLASTIKFGNFSTKTDPEAVRSSMREAYDWGCKVFIVDNFNYMMPVFFNDRLSEEDTAVHGFVQFVKELPIHLIMVVHPNKGTNKNKANRVENEFDLKGSSTLSQEAQNIFLFNRVVDQSERRLPSGGMNPEFFIREITIRKMRRKGINVGSRLYFNAGISMKYEEDLCYRQTL